MRFTRIAACLAALVLGTAAPAEDGPQPPARPERVDALLAPLVERHGVPALGGAIVALDGLAAVGVAGHRAAGHDAEVAVDDLWHLGSCTKAMTATLLARYAEREVLSLDTRLPAALPQLAETFDAGWKDVTLRELLQHRGGAPTAVEPRLWGRLFAFEGTPAAARALLVSETLRGAPAGPHGEHFEYSNTGYAIAAHALETRTERPWESLVQSDLFEPLDMHPGFGAPGTAGTEPDQPWGHREVGGALAAVPPGPGADNPPAIGPAGTVHASLADWAKFVGLHLRGARPDAAGLLLPRAAFEALHTPPAGADYALGWRVTTREWARGEGGTGRVLMHAGSNTMWYCVAWIAPERGIAVLATCNAGGRRGEQACDAVCGALLRHAHADTAEPQRPR